MMLRFRYTAIIPFISTLLGYLDFAPSFLPEEDACRSLFSRSFRGVLLALRLRHPTVCPVTLARGASLPDFSPGAAGRGFFRGASRSTFSPAAVRSYFS